MSAAGPDLGPVRTWARSSPDEFDGAVEGWLRKAYDGAG